MAHYLIEFRLRGFAKKYSQELIKEIGKKFRVRGMKGKVSHITLYGPFSTNNEKRVVSEVLNLCRKYDRIYFSIKGVDYFDNSVNKTIYLDIIPSEKFKTFRFELASKLNKITSTESKEDSKNKENFKFHSTIAFKDINLKLVQILRYLKNRKHPNIRQTLLRLTILKNNKILYEYDFLLKQLLNRRQALNRQIFRETIKRLRQMKYPQKIKLPLVTKKLTIFEKIKSFLGVKIK